MTTAAEIWNLIQPGAIKCFGNQVIENWLTHLSPATIEGDIFTFHTTQAVVKNWVSQRYTDDILRLLRSQLPSLKHIEIIIKEHEESTKSGIRKSPKNEQQLDLFVPVITDISPRDARDVMEYPFLSLSKQKRTKPIIYGDINNPTIHIYAPLETGIANIYDWDIIIFCATQIRAALNAGRPVGNIVRIVPAEYLRATRRHNGKKYQDSITEGLRRLKATQVETTIRLDDQQASFKKDRHFSWINDYTVTSRIINTAKGPKEIVQHYEVELCQWLYKAICSTKLVLSLDQTYFLLDGGYERWLYRLVRKSAGKGHWQWTFSQLYERSGKGEEYKHFVAHMRKIVKAAEKEPIIPGYAVTICMVPGQGGREEPALRANYIGNATEEAVTN